MDEPKKRGRGRPPKYTPDNPKPKRDEKNPLDVIRKPAVNWLPNTVDIPEGDNNKYTTFALAIMQLRPINLANADDVQQRVLEYFQLCADYDMKPGIAAVALALGTDRRRLWEIYTDQEKQLLIPQECKAIIKRVYNSLDFLWESYMQNGKINPVTGIFLGKNNFGYKDQQEYVLTPNQQNGDTDPATIAAKYDELPE